MCLQSLFPLEKQREEDTDEDEDTAANSAQLAEWDGMELDNVEEEFSEFESANKGEIEDDSLLVSEERNDRPGREDVVISLPTPRYRELKRAI